NMFNTQAGLRGQFWNWMQFPPSFSTLRGQRGQWQALASLDMHVGAQPIASKEALMISGGRRSILESLPAADARQIETYPGFLRIAFARYKKTGDKTMTFLLIGSAQGEMPNLREPMYNLGPDWTFVTVNGSSRLAAGGTARQLAEVLLRAGFYP